MTNKDTKTQQPNNKNMKTKDLIPLTKEQATIISAFTGILCCESFGDVHEYIEKIAGRPVYTHEMGNTPFMAEIKEKIRPDFMKIVYRKANE